MIVVDSAPLVDALTGVEGTDELRACLRGEALHAPALLDYEIVSALRGLTIAGRISPTRAQDALTDLADLPIRRWAAGDALRRRAFSLRESLSAYAALAEALECRLVTRDARLARSGGHAAVITVR
jgi:predicted nucleic acid-binding protein